MKAILLLILLLLCQLVGFGQIITLKNEEFAKVEVQLDEMIPPFKYVIINPFIHPRSRNPKFYNTRSRWADIEYNYKLKNGTLTKADHAEQMKDLAIYYGYAEDSTHIVDSLTLFYIWKPEGVYQIATRKQLKSKKVFKKKNKTYPFDKIITPDYFQLVKNLKLPSFESKNQGYGWSSVDNIYSNKYSYFDKANSPLAIETHKEDRWEYFIISLNYYKFLKPSSYLGFDKINNLQLEYTIKPSDLWFNKEEEKRFITADNHYKDERLLAIYNEILGYSDVYYRKYSMDYNLIYGNQAKFKPFEGNLIPFFNIDQIRESNNADSLITHLSEYNLDIISKNDCPYGYSIKNEKMLSEPVGILVVPNKFIISQRLKILLVNDKPWEEFKSELCK